MEEKIKQHIEKMHNQLACMVAGIEAVPSLYGQGKWLAIHDELDSAGGSLAIVLEILNENKE